MSESTFADVLKRRASKLHTCFEHMVERAEDDWVHLLKPDHGSHSGMIHLRNVQRCADKMIPAEKKEQFSDGEIFVLLASILLHDLGRIIPDRPRREIAVRWLDRAQPSGADDYQRARAALGNEGWLAPQLKDALVKLWGLGEFKDVGRELGRFDDTRPNPPSYRFVQDTGEYCPLKKGKKGKTCDDPRRCRQEQKTHACRTKHLVDLYWPHFGLPDEPVARLCGLVAFCHQLEQPPDEQDDMNCQVAKSYRDAFVDTSLEPYGRIRVPLLAAILRLADETEDSWTRAIRQHWYEQLLRIDSTDLYKAFRRGIADVQFYAEEHCIVMHMNLGLDSEVEDSKTLVDDLTDKVDTTRRALRVWGKLLEPAGVSYTHVFVQQDGMLSQDPRMPRRDAPSLADTLGKPVKRPKKDKPKEMEALQGELVSKATIRRYFDQLRYLVSGTWGYTTYRWSSVEGAIGEPLDAQKKWIIQRMGNVDKGLCVRPRDDKDEVEIRFESRRLENLSKKLMGQEENAS